MRQVEIRVRSGHGVVEALLGVFMKGPGLDVLWPQLAWMSGLGAMLVAVAGKLFGQRIA